MNVALIGELVRLRYKLLWAVTRTRNGRIALFIAGYVLFVLGVALFSHGGWNAALLAVRLGRAELMAELVLTSVFLQAVIVTVTLGFGMSAIFSDSELRRYPLNASDRWLTRHLIAMVDPFWFLVLAVDMGLAVGLYVLGAGELIAGVFAVLLLFVCNYVFARVFAVVVERIAGRKTGSAVLLIAILALVVGAARLPQLLRRDPAFAESAIRMLRDTPPFGAAAAMIGGGFGGTATILCWLLGLCAALVALERMPEYRPGTEDRGASFDSFYDRAAAWFGIGDAPLAAQWLRFYLRNNRLRIQSLITLPVIALLTARLGRGGSYDLFLAALGTFSLAAFVGPGRLAVNQFGYADGGIRRYFLLPVDPTAVLRTGSSTSMLLGASMTALALIGWAILVRPFDARAVFWIFASSLTGIFVLWALGLWTSILAPHRGKYSQTIGPDMSLAGMVVLIGAVLVFLLVVPGFADRMAPEPRLLEMWWIAPVPVLLAWGFYAGSLRAAGAVLRRRRERLIAVIEGKL